MAVTPPYFCYCYQRVQKVRYRRYGGRRNLSTEVYRDLYKTPFNFLHFSMSPSLYGCDWWDFEIWQIISGKPEFLMDDQVPSPIVTLLSMCETFFIVHQGQFSCFPLISWLEKRDEVQVKMSPSNTWECWRKLCRITNKFEIHQRWIINSTLCL